MPSVVGVEVGRVGVCSTPTSKVPLQATRVGRSSRATRRDMYFITLHLPIVWFCKSCFYATAPVLHPYGEGVAISKHRVTTLKHQRTIGSLDEPDLLHKPVQNC